MKNLIDNIKSLIKGSITVALLIIAIFFGSSETGQKITSFLTQLDSVIAVEEVVEAPEEELEEPVEE